MFDEQNCRDNTAGEHCEVCDDSFYGDPDVDGCKPCPCPRADKRFSSTCVVRPDEDTVCKCKPGEKMITTWRKKKCHKNIMIFHEFMIVCKVNNIMMG